LSARVDRDFEDIVELSSKEAAWNFFCDECVFKNRAFATIIGFNSDGKCPSLFGIRFDEKGIFVRPMTTVATFIRSVLTYERNPRILWSVIGRAGSRGSRRLTQSTSKLVGDYLWISGLNVGNRTSQSDGEKRAEEGNGKAHFIVNRQ
jgi:hypothetical protein